MFQVTFDLGKLTDWLSLLVNSLVFISGLIVLWISRRNLAELVKQLRSQSQHQVMEAHKTLYMPIVQDSELSSLIFENDPADTRTALMASMIINHSSRVHADFESGMFSKDHVNGLAADMAGIFRVPAIAKRWQVARLYHRPAFVSFVETAVQASIAADTAHPDPLFGQQQSGAVAPDLGTVTPGPECSPTIDRRSATSDAPPALGIG